MSETIFTIDGPVATLTWNRPASRNALTWAMYENLVRACDRVDEDAAVRTFVLKGAGNRAFAAGTDIRQFAAFKSAEDGAAYESRIDGVLERLAAVRVPTIAEVQGVAAGGGCAIAFTCDLRVCGPGASFGVPIARTLGNCLSEATCARMLQVLSVATLKDLLFTGRMLDVDEARRLGIVSRLAPTDDLAAITQQLCRRIAANAPLTIRASKSIVRRLSESTDVRDRSDAAEILLCYGSEDFREGVAAFTEKRVPQWKGR